MLSSCATQKPATNSMSYEEDRQFTALFMDAEKERMLGNYEKAAELYHECLKIDPSNAAAYYALGNVFTETDQVQEALPFALRAMELDPKNVWYARFAADIHLGLNNYGEAADIMERLVKQYPNKVEYLYDLAGIQLYRNKLEEALNIYDRIEERVGVTEDISVQKEKIYLELDRLQDAVQELENLITNYPGEQRYLGMLAEVYVANDKLEDAMKVYERMQENDPTDPILALNLAEYHRKKGNHDTSFDYLKKAFSSPTLNIDNKIQVMMSYYSLSENNDKMLKQAYTLLELLTKAHPEDAKAFAMQADFLLRDGKWEEARSSFYRTVELDSSRFPVWEQLINTSYRMGDHEAMEKDSRTALELFPNQGFLYLMNGIALNAQERHEEAVSILNEGEMFTRSNSYMHVQLLSVLGDAYNSLKEYDRSDEAFEKALDKEPTNPLLLNNYSYYLSLRKENLDRAEEMSKRSNLLEPRQASYQDTYAWILYQQEKYDEALEWIVKALENGGANSGLIVEHHGDILFRLGRKEEAMEQWQIAAELDDHTDALQDKIDGKQLP